MATSEVYSDFEAIKKLVNNDGCKIEYFLYSSTSHFNETYLI
jgi:hypothetical protein